MWLKFWHSSTFKFWFVSCLCILLLPMIAGLFYYGSVQHNLFEKSTEISQMAINQTASVMNERMKMVNQVGDSIYMSSEIKRIKYLSLPYTASTYYELHRRAEYLGNFSLQTDLFDQIYVYYSDMNCMMDSQRILTEDNQLGRVIQNTLHLDRDTFSDLMAQKHYNRFLMTTNGNLLYLRTLSTRDNDTPIITLIAAISTDFLHEVLHSTSYNANGFAWICDADGHILSERESVPVTYDTLISNNDTEHQRIDGSIVVSAPIGNTGLLCALSIPEETILQPVNRSRQWYWMIFCLSLIVGSFFCYILTVRNYRPIHALKERFSGPYDTKDDFSLINAKLSELLKQETAMQTEISRLDSIAQKEAFRQLLSNGYDALNDTQRKAIHFRATTFVVVWLRTEEEQFSLQNADGTSVDSELVLQVYLNHLCENTFEYASQQEENGYVIEFGLLRPMDPMDAQSEIIGLCTTLVKQLNIRYPRTPVHAFIGDACTGLDNIHISYKNALRAQVYAEYALGGEELLVPYDPLMYSTDISWKDYDIMDSEHKFIHLMLEGCYTQAERLLHEILSYYIGTDGMNVYVLQCRMFGVMNMLLNVLHEIEPDLIASGMEDFSPMEKLITARSPSELERVAFEIMSRLIGTQERKDTDVAKPRIAQIQRYIDANYADPNLSVQMVADAFSISLPYLSRIFKKEYGSGLLDYINRYRVEKAKELLRNGSEKSIATIAVSIGFSSSQTLIRAFKRYEGVTPGQYKLSVDAKM